MLCVHVLFGTVRSIFTTNVNFTPKYGKVPSNMMLVCTEKKIVLELKQHIGFRFRVVLLLLFCFVFIFMQFWVNIYKTPDTWKFLVPLVKDVELTCVIYK